MKTNISKALKIKNRLAGEVTRLRGIFRRENSKRNDNISKVDAEVVDKQIAETLKKLIAVKSAITETNAGIYGKLAALEEAKASIAFLQSLPTKEGEEKTAVGYGKETITYNWKAFLNQEAVDKRIAVLQKQADTLQDEIDEFNATHFVELPD